MRRVGKHLFAIGGRVLFIGFSVQIMLGLVWMFCNFGARQHFAPSDRGILYSALLWLAPHYCVIYILQIIAALWAGCFFLKSIHPAPFWNIWGSFAILTVPMGMQCHLALLPDSLVSSLVLAECAFFWCAVSAETKKNRVLLFAQMCICWLFLALLDEMYLYFGAILPIVLLLVALCGRKRFQMVSLILLFGAFTGIGFGTYDLARAAGKYEIERKSVPEMLFDRFAWSTILKQWGEWPQELNDLVDDNIIMTASWYPDGFSIELKPALEQVISREEMDALSINLAKEAWELYPGQILHECIWDAAGYVFSPAITGLMLEGRGYNSHCQRNYDIMSEQTPKLTRYYVDYGCWWFGVAFLLAAFLECLMMFIAKRMPSGKTLGCLAAFAIACGCLVVWYVMQGAGIMDYKHTIFITSLWVIWQIQVCRGALSGTLGDSVSGGGQEISE